MAGFIQVPADAGGKRVDTVTLTDATVEVHRQKIVMTGGSGTAEVCVVTNAAPASGDMGLVVRQAGTVNVAVTTGTFNLSGTAIVAGSIDISSMPAVVLAAGAANIGDINAISRTVQVAIGTPFTVNNISAAVVLAAGAANIGSINNISRTVAVICSTPFIIQGISTTVQVAVGTPFTVNNISATVVVSGLVGLTAGTSVIGDLNAISRTVQVAIGTPFTVNNISAAVVLAAGAANIGSINNISRTVVCSLAHVIEKTSNSEVQVGDSANAAIRVNVVAGSAGGPSMTDNTTYSTGASLVAPAGFIFFSASATAVTDGRVAAGRITDARGQHVNLRNNAGTEIGTATTPVHVLQSATASVLLAAGTANFGTLNNISATVVTGLSYVIEKTSNSQVQVGDSANAAIRVNVVAGAAGGVSQTDGTTFTSQAATFVPIGGIFDDASPDTLSENDAGVVRLTTNRAFHANLRTDGGVKLDDSTNSALRVNVVAIDAPSAVFTDGNPFTAQVTPVVVMGGVFDDATPGTLSENDAGAVRLTTNRAFHINHRTDGGVAMEDSANSALRVNVVAGAASGVSQVDGTTFTSQAAAFVPIGGIFDDASSSTLSENDAGVVRLTTNRAFHVNLRDTTGAELGAASATGVFIRTATVALAADQILGSISRTVQVAIGTPFILQGISTTVQVAIATPYTLQGISTTVNVAIATPFTVNNISRTVVCGLSYVIEATTNSEVKVGDSANQALRVNIVAGAAGGVSQVDGTTFTSQAASFIPIGGIFDDATSDTLSENDAGVVRMTTNRAFHINIRDAAGAELGAASATGIFVRTATIALAADQILGSISRTVQVAIGTPFTVNNISASVAVTGNFSATSTVVIAAGAAVIGDLNAISRTVQVAIGTPFILQGISTTVQVAIATPYILQGISTTVSVITSAQMAHDSSVTAGVVPVQMGLRANQSAPAAVANADATLAWADKFGRRVNILNHPSLLPSASHGPKCVTCSTSAGIALIAAPGAGLAVYITKIACTNGSGTLTRADVFQASATASCTAQMYMAASGGGFTMDYNPPIQCASNTGVTCRVKPSVSQAIFNVHFYVGNK